MNTFQPLQDLQSLTETENEWTSSLSPVYKGILVSLQANFEPSGPLINFYLTLAL